MKRLILLSLLTATFSVLLAQQPSPSYRLRGNGSVVSKNYYLLSLFAGEEKVRQLLLHDPILAGIARHKRQAEARALHECSGSASCMLNTMLFSEGEIDSVGKRLVQLYNQHSALSDLVRGQLIPSGAYILYAGQPQDWLKRSWEEDARGVNYVIRVYGIGDRPHYPNIDSISFDVRSRAYPELVYDALYTSRSEAPATELFFMPSLSVATTLLQINERENAADFEPMQRTVNKAAFERIPTIQWSQYPYTLILVPGYGPEEKDVALSGEGKLRCRLAAQQYFKKQAPFIMVSGGKAHPYKTRFCEAQEMKRFLIGLGVPENAILMDPHARHTTTNMRNCARIIFRYGMPFDKPCLVTTTRYQSNLIGTSFVERCRQELHEVPYRVGRRLSETDLEFYPLVEALQINPEEPMDP